MELLEVGEFLRWAAEGGIDPDPHGRDRQAPLTFRDSSLYVRRWLAPEAPFNLPGFASFLLGSHRAAVAGVLVHQGRSALVHGQ
jgi:hypothetical protein